MPRTIRRQPFNVSTNNNNFPKSYFYNQTQFKGICDNANDINIDPQTFESAKNMYVDENGVLTSRPPLKFYDGEAYIIDQWLFGAYGLRLHRILCKKSDEGYVKVEHPSDVPTDELYFAFLLRSITHNTIGGTLNNGDRVYSEMQWIIPLESIGWDFIPKVTCAQIEDKIFVWFAGVDFVAFNTSGVLMSNGSRYLYFESAVKYLYYPIHKLVINGIESDLETKNFLTETYKRRYQYSALSTVNFERLIGRHMSVNMNGDTTQGKSKHLYDITMEEHQDKMLVYPYSPVGSNYHIDIAQTIRSTVVLRYSIATHIIEVSFDGRYFRPVPTLDDIIGMPMLTRDGLWAVAFTTKGVAKCKLVAQESIDFIEAEEVFSWVVEPYMHNALMNGFPAYLDTIDTTFVPVGYFETIDQFAYIFRGPSVYSDLNGNIPYIYTEWLSGANDKIWSFNALVQSNKNHTHIIPMIANDDIKVHFRYVAPTVDHQDLGATVSIMTSTALTFDDNDTDAVEINSPLMMLFFFKQEVENINRVLKNDDHLYVTELLGTRRDENADDFSAYIYRMNASGTQAVNNDDNVYTNDIILCTPYPYTISDTADYSETRNYHRGDYCLYAELIYYCIQDCIGMRPLDNSQYWRLCLHPADNSQPLTKYEKYTFWFQSGDTTTELYVNFDWRFNWLRYTNVRYRLECLSDSSVVSPNTRIRVSSYNTDVKYTANELTSMFGALTVYRKDDTIVSGVNGWEILFGGGLSVPKASNTEIYTGNAIIYGVDNPAIMDRFRLVNTGINIQHNGTTYYYQNYNSPCTRLDIHAMAPTITAESKLYEFVIAYNLLCKNDNDKSLTFDCLCKYEYDFVADEVKAKDDGIQIISANSQWFKIMPNTDTMITDLYMFCDKELIPLPTNGELTPLVTDKERAITNNDNLILALTNADDEVQYYNGNIHKVTNDGVNIASGAIQSGDIISYTKNAVTETDYVTSNNGLSNRFVIEHLSVNADGNLVGIVGGDIKSGELVRLRAYDKQIVLPVGHPGNPYTDRTYVIEPYVYPAAPNGWQIGDDWPASFPTYPPIYANADGTIRHWAPGDPLPSGPILLYGMTNIFKRIQPISLDSNGVWYNIDGTLWTSQVSTDAFLELDEYVNAELRNILDDDGNVAARVRVVDLNLLVPDAFAVMNEYYFSYVDQGKNLLEITQTKRDEDKYLTDEGTDMLLYLPKRNEQRFANKMTALHPLSDTEMGIFTEKDVWYTSTTVLSDGTVAYTKPVKSKIPIGLRAGSQVITALDGQALIFPTPRGLVALAPQDFVATTEKTLSYLSDAIQEKYHSFYNDGVMSALLIPDEFELSYQPYIRLNTFKYWILMYKYLDREILALDTRTGTWWLWTTPYPIRSIMVGSRLHILQQIDFSPISEAFTIVHPMKDASLMGVSFIWADKEIDELAYADDTVDKSLNGLSILVYENEFIGDRRILQYASPIIDWHFTSQKLHFDQINNYKLIKGINMNVKGDTTMTAKLSTKAYRSLTHPEHAEVVEMKINDIRTLVKKFNLMHVIDFQFKIENDTSNNTQHQFKLNSLSVKYEVKERVR